MKNNEYNSNISNLTNNEYNTNNNLPKNTKVNNNLYKNKSWNNKVKKHLKQLKTVSQEINRGIPHNNSTIKNLTTSGFFSGHGSCGGEYGCEMEKVKAYQGLVCALKKRKHSFKYSDNLIKKVENKTENHAKKIKMHKNSYNSCPAQGGKKTMKKKSTKKTVKKTTTKKKSTTKK